MRRARPPSGVFRKKDLCTAGVGRGERVSAWLRPGLNPQRERVLYWEPTGPNPLYHQGDLGDRPRAMGIWITFSKKPCIYLLVHFAVLADVCNLPKVDYRPGNKPKSLKSLPDLRELRARRLSRLFPAVLQGYLAHENTPFPRTLP